MLLAAESYMPDYRAVRVPTTRQVRRLSGHSLSYPLFLVIKNFHRNVLDNYILLATLSAFSSLGENVIRAKFAGWRFSAVRTGEPQEGHGAQRIIGLFITCVSADSAFCQPK